jgi:hypothetical protein
MIRADAIEYVAYTVDDSLNARDRGEPGFAVPDHARLVGWQCGFEPMVVAVFSYLPGIHLTDEDAEGIARDYLEEIKWFSETFADNPADFVL